MAQPDPGLLTALPLYACLFFALQMFPLPVANGKGRPASLAGTQFAGSGRTEGYWGFVHGDCDEICLLGDSGQFLTQPHQSVVVLEPIELY